MLSESHLGCWDPGRVLIFYMIAPRTLGCIYASNVPELATLSPPTRTQASSVSLADVLCTPIIALH